MMSFAKFLDVAKEEDESILSTVWLAQTLEAILFQEGGHLGVSWYFPSGVSKPAR